MTVLRGWDGKPVVLVPFLGPGISLEPASGALRFEVARRGLVRLHVGITVALPSATFIEADWVPGQEERGLSIVQGAARVDVFLDDD
jgi:hypothetical protein